MSDDDLYFLVTAEPLLSAFAEWRNRYSVTQSALWGFARKYGAKSFYPDLDNNLRALIDINPAPPGWQRVKRKRGEYELRPAKGEAGQSVRDEIAELPKMPTTLEAAKIIGHPTDLSYEASDGSGSGMLGVGHWDVVRVAWTPDQTVLVTPNIAARVAEITKQHPDAKITRGEWTAPPGLTPTTKARVDLLFAQARVAAEETALRARVPVAVAAE